MSSVIVRWMPDPTESIRLTWKTISPFFFLKRHLYFFLSKTGFCQTRYFSNMRVRFFPQHVEKIRVYCGSAPLLTSNTNPHTHMVIFLDIVGFTRNRQKIVNIVSQVYVCIYTYLLHIGTIEI